MAYAGDVYTMGGGYYLYDTCGSDLLARGDDDVNGRFDVVERRPNSGEYYCGSERASQSWLNLDAVREAIHVQSQHASGRAFSFSTQLNYSFTAHTLLPLYNQTLIHHYRILQYSGDADPCVPYIGTERWIESLNLPVSAPWRPWTVDDRVAGYVRVYDAASREQEEGEQEQNNTFTFATVRDAGHMVPRYKPNEALHLFRHFLNNLPL